MNPVAYDIAAKLASSSLGTVASTSDWGIYIDALPDQPTNCIVVSDFSSPPPIVPSSGANPLDRGSFQVLVRGSDHSAVFQKALAISKVLTGLRYKISESGKKDVDYRGIVRQSDFTSVASGVKGVYIRTVSFLAHRQETV